MTLRAQKRRDRNVVVLCMATLAVWQKEGKEQEGEAERERVGERKERERDTAFLLTEACRYDFGNRRVKLAWISHL